MKAIRILRERWQLESLVAYIHAVISETTIGTHELKDEVRSENALQCYEFMWATQRNITDLITETQEICNKIDKYHQESLRKIIEKLYKNM